MVEAIGQEMLKVAVAGMSHDHVHVLFNLYKQNQVDLVGIAERDTALIHRMQKRYHLPDALFYPSLDSLLKKVKPTVVLAYNPVAEHVDVAEACLPLRIPVMVEKPLAATATQAQRIAQLAKKYNTLFLTNYETTWYRSNHRIKALTNQHTLGKLKKIVVRDGHQGPKEIGCSADFLNWLTDPVKNGGGALMDFGCYGANLMTWLKQGERPLAVTAVTRHLKPQIYPKVEDDATIVLEYADGTTGLIQASWDWSYNIKDMQIFGDSKMLHARDDHTLLEYQNVNDYKEIPLDNTYYTNHLAYLKDVLAGKIEATNDLSSLTNNLVVMEILEAAKRSANEGKRIVL
ncbi:Gfo/Idh/MocA family oxidoreductase [Olivibacter ginsenosidimutans]|uniref:Gfo/Idh/MocA family oxidoreductase n=2 Tax=Olivibacter ginsenosidimutans TaxID=1176537 RepID=A0ABP9BJY3_9SPHI